MRIRERCRTLVFDLEWCSICLVSRHSHQNTANTITALWLPRVEKAGVGAAGADGGFGLGAALGASALVGGALAVAVDAAVDRAALPAHRDPRATAQGLLLLALVAVVGRGEAFDLQDVVGAGTHGGGIGQSMLRTSSQRLQGGMGVSPVVKAQP